MRKPLNRLTKKYGNEEDRDTIMAVLLKRMLEPDQIIEYLLSAVPERLKDDMLGEIEAYYSNKKLWS